MRRPGFLHGALAAAALALLAGLLAVILTPLIGPGAVLRLVAPILGLAYLVYLFRATRQRTGRVVTLVAWIALSVALWWTAPPLALTLMILGGALWLVRALSVYSGVLPALLDLGLCTASALACAWAFLRTGSVFAAAWCAFLVQALWVVIPRRLPARGAGHGPPADDGRFERARRQADTALRQLANP